MDGQVWNGFGREWIWESGVTVAEPPFRVSGVYISSEFHPVNETGPYSHHVDYQNGRVVFDVPQDPNAHHSGGVLSSARQRGPGGSSRVPGAYAARHSGVRAPPRRPPARPPESTRFGCPPSSLTWSAAAQRGLELGGGQIKTRNIVLHIFADRVSDRNLLADWLDLQSRAAFDLADLNSVTLPFDSYGGVVSGVTNWPDMAAQYPWKKLRIMDGEVSKTAQREPQYISGSRQFEER